MKAKPDMPDPTICQFWRDMTRDSINMTSTQSVQISTQVLNLRAPKVVIQSVTFSQLRKT